MAQSILETFEKTGALLNGHFVLSSGLRSREYFQCALVLQHTELAAGICADLASRLADVECDAVISPAMGAEDRSEILKDLPGLGGNIAFEQRSRFRF